jgi:hypothetical protein
MRSHSHRATGVLIMIVVVEAAVIVLSGMLLALVFG